MTAPQRPRSIEHRAHAPPAVQRDGRRTMSPLYHRGGGGITAMGYPVQVLLRHEKGEPNATRDTSTTPPFPCAMLH